MKILQLAAAPILYYWNHFCFALHEKRRKMEQKYVLNVLLHKEEMQIRSFFFEETLNHCLQISLGEQDEELLLGNVQDKSVFL